MNNSNTNNFKICSFCESPVDINEWFDFQYHTSAGVQEEHYFCDITCSHLWIEFILSEMMTADDTTDGMGPQAVIT